MTALALHALRARLRSPGALALAVVATLGLAALAVGGPSGAESGAVSLASALLGVGIAAGFAASASGGSLPDDRLSGRAEWLATLRPSLAAHRLAAAMAGAALSAIVGVLGAALVAVLLLASGQEVATTAAHPLRAERGAGGGLATFALPAEPADGGRGLPVELEVRPLFRDLSRAPPTTVGVRLTWQVGSTPVVREERLPLRGLHRTQAPPGASRLRVDEADPTSAVVARVLAARRIGAPTPFARNVVAAGLLLGLGCALAVPFAVLVSRATSAPTASLATALVLLIGVAREPLLDFAVDLVSAPGPGAGSRAFASTVVRVAALLAPDLSALHDVGEAAAGRALSLASFAGLLPAAAHALACAGLLALPSPRSRRLS